MEKKLSFTTHQCNFYILVQQYILHAVSNYTLQQNIKRISHRLINDTTTPFLLLYSVQLKDKKTKKYTQDT